VAATRLLLVEDDRHSREGYRDYLVGAGFEVLALDGGQQVADVARRLTPHLVVLDLALPDVDGWEVARQLKADATTRSIPIIAFSARTLHHEKASALRAGCDLYLAKPCPPEQLLSEVRKLLGIKEPAPDPAGSAPDPY
jgi:two-component system cell cycle response regulator DivK